ncbi:MAG: hypothetical protein ABIH46_08690, partial [Chloroflexota bacterium]
MDSKEAPLGWGVDHGDIGMVFTPRGVVAYDYEQLQTPPAKGGNWWDLRRAYWHLYLDSTAKAATGSEPIRAILAAEVEKLRELMSSSETTNIVVNIPSYQPLTASIWDNPWIVQIGGGVIVLLIGLLIGFFLRP